MTLVIETCAMLTGRSLPGREAMRAKYKGPGSSAPGKLPWHRPLAIAAGAAPVPTPCGSKRGRDDLRARTGFGLDSHRAVPQTELCYVLSEIEYSVITTGCVQVPSGSSW